MMVFGKTLVFLLFPLSNFGQIAELLQGLDKVTDFALHYHERINFDGLLGFVIAEAQIIQSLQLPLNDDIKTNLKYLLDKHEKIRKIIALHIPTRPSKMIVLKKYLLHPEGWITGEPFLKHTLADLGIYRNWTADLIVSNKLAVYNNIPSDHCLKEILAQNCYISPFCSEMMLAPRVDTGYLVSHRLFYMQIVRLKGCPYQRSRFRSLTNNFCSLMLKEVRTNDYLHFPAHDIALEQMVLCGIEGYSEFLNEKWRNKIIEWQTPFGCYKSREELNLKRSSNIIEFGCSDHTTGLGAATLALNLRFILNVKY